MSAPQDAFSAVALDTQSGAYEEIGRGVTGMPSGEGYSTRVHENERDKMASPVHGRGIKTREHRNINTETTMHGNREHSGHANTGTGTGHGQGRKGLVKQRRQRKDEHDELDPNLEEE
ncbi:hypothetical protein EDD85DRAFT_788832 [Armillaria nabsnona]|nr:hypothetical protein EDD85DRAFT_788832 [Armillaria nabsnona]